MSRGRKPIEIDREQFQLVVTQLETNQSFQNRTALWAAVSETDWAKNLKPRALSPQVAMIKADQFGLNVTTPKGKKGREKGSGPVPRGNRKQRRVSLEVVELQKKNFSESLYKTIDRAAAGSAKAAIKLKCIDCCAGSKKEVALCTINECPLWGFRPYKRESDIKD